MLSISVRSISIFRILRYGGSDPKVGEKPIIWLDLCRKLEPWERGARPNHHFGYANRESAK